MIHREDIENVQKLWSRMIVRIGALKEDRNVCEAYARERLDDLYAFEKGDVLFKPTKASVTPFRLNKLSALSYFIGGNPEFAEDRGFALEPWVKVRFQNVGFILKEKHATAVGNAYFTNANQKEIQAHYTFGYIKCEGSLLKIEAHHSSLPFEA